LDLSQWEVAEATRTTREKLSEISFSPKKRVLDLACGISVFGKSFGGEVHGIDNNREAVKLARKNGINAKFGDVEKKLTYPNDYFDVVIASHTIEHLVNPDHLVLEAKRVLKKGGLLIVVTPNLASWINRLLLLLGFQPFFTEVSTVDKTLGIKFSRKFTKVRSTVGHMRVFTSGALKDILELHGFNIYKTAGVEFVAFPRALRLLDRLLAKNFSLASIIIVVGKKR